jgi:hypothetical protein
MPVNSRSPHGPFHQSTFFWGCAGAFITIVVTVVAAMVKDLRWLLVFAWPFAGLAIWEFSRTWSSPLITKWATGIGAVVAGVVLLALYVWIAPTTQSIPIQPSAPLVVDNNAISPSHSEQHDDPSSHANTLNEIVLIDPPQSSRQNPNGTERVFVRVHPDDLQGFFSGHTDDQAKLLAAPFINKWIAITGPVYDIFSHSRPNIIEIDVISTKMVSSALLVILFEMKWKDKIDTLRKGDKISAACRIYSIERIRIKLDRCELIER